MRNLKTIACSALLAGLLSTPAAIATPGDTIYETCPDIDDAGDVRCYPIHYTAKTEVHPNGLPIVAYLFVPKNLPTSGEALPAIVFAHGSGSMFSSGNHNQGLNSKHKQWTRQFTAEQGIVSLHVSSFQSRYYMLPDTAGDQRMFDWENPPAPDTMGGDDYRATSTVGGQEEGDLYVNVPFDPNADDWKDQSNGRAGVSELIERPYDLEAGYDYLVGMIDGTTLPNAQGETLAAGFTASITQKINDLVPGLVIDPERVFVYGTSHGGQTIQALAHKPRATASSHPMGNHPRFAAYFNFYGGCGLYGAFGGADSGSTWYPVGPFFNLHAELDDIWQESTEPTTRETWEKGECAPRIENALANPDFDTLLNTVLVADAEHSFSGAKKGEGADWHAKVFADYEVVIPAMEAIGWMTWARRISATTQPSFSNLGIGHDNALFSTLPVTPTMLPFNRLMEDNQNGVLAIGNVTNADIDLDTLFAERSGEVDLSFQELAKSDTSSLFVMAGSDTLSLRIDATTLDELSNGDLIDRGILLVSAPTGRHYAPFELVFTGGDTGELRFTTPILERTGQVFETELDADGALDVDLKAFLPPSYRNRMALTMAFYGGLLDEDTLEVDFDGRLTGQPGTLPRNFTIQVSVRHLQIDYDVKLTHGVRNGLVNMSLARKQIKNTIILPTTEVKAPDFSNLSITPGLPSSGPLTLSTSGSGWSERDDGSDDDGSDDGGSGDDGSGDDGSGDDGSGDDGSSGGSSGGGSSGGGALLWLLPVAILLRRRSRD